MFELTFAIESRVRPFEILAPGFVAINDEVPPCESLHLARIGPPAPFVAVELDVTAGSAAAGLANQAGDHLVARWSSPTQRLTVELRIAGRTRVLRRKTIALPDAFSMAFVVCENQVTVFVDSGAGWAPALTERDKVSALFDLTMEPTLRALRYAWSSGEPASVRAGIFGMTGLRDPHLVQHADGRPYERDGRLFMTWSCAGPGFFQQAHWTVWSFDPSEPADQRLEAQLFSRRDGRVLGDHAGQLVRDGRRWHVAVSSWGDFQPGHIHVRHTTTTRDLLRGIHILDTEPTELPTPSGTWDPAITRQGDRWLVAYVASPSQSPFDFHPSLAQTNAEAWHKGLSEVFAADELHQSEGPILVELDEEAWLLASDGAARNYPVFRLDGRRVGRLDAPYPTNIPHPQLVPAPNGGVWLITFDGTPFREDVLGYGTHGDLLVMWADRGGAVMQGTVRDRRRGGTGQIRRGAHMVR